MRRHKVVAELQEGPERVADMQVGLEEQAMQIVGQVPLGHQTEERIVEMFDTLAVLAAKVDITSRRDIERNELEWRPEVVRPSRVLLVLRSIAIAQEVIGRLRVPQHLCNDVSGGGKKGRQHRYDGNDTRNACSP